MKSFAQHASVMIIPATLAYRGNVVHTNILERGWCRAERMFADAKRWVIHIRLKKNKVQTEIWIISRNMDLWHNLRLAQQSTLHFPL
jgi:hypothetical protein